MHSSGTEELCAICASPWARLGKNHLLHNRRDVLVQLPELGIAAHPQCMEYLLVMSGEQNGIDYYPIYEMLMGYEFRPLPGEVKRLRRKEQWALR